MSKLDTTYHEYKLSHIDWMFEGMEIEQVLRIAGKWEADSGLEIHFASDGVNPPIVLQIIPVLESGEPKLDFIVTKCYSQMPMAAPEDSTAYPPRASGGSLPISAPIE